MAQKIVCLLACIALVGSFSGCNAAGVNRKLLQDEATITVTSTAPAVKSLYQILEGVEDLSVLKSLVDFAGPDFVGLLNSTDTAYTVFAPTNKAFEKLLAQAGAEAASNQTLVQAILATHVVFNATLTAEDAAAADGQSVESLVEGVSLTVHVDTSGIYIASPGNAAKVVDTDIVGGKGIAHVIDAVLLPQADDEPSLYDLAEETAALHTLVTLVDFAGEDYVNLLKNRSADITVFAPTNDAFVQLLAEYGEAAAANQTLVQAILRTHVVPAAVYKADAVDGAYLETAEEGVFLTVELDEQPDNTTDVHILSPGSWATVLTFDVEAGNQVAHVIDTVLLPFDADDGSLYDLIADDTNLSILKGLIDFAGEPFVSTLKNLESNITVFAPTDEAFIALLAAVEVNTTDVEEVAGILLTHVVGMPIYSSDATNGTEVETLGGSTLTVLVDEAGDIYIASPGNPVPAKVTGADAVGGEGVLHVIDGVLIPKLDDAEQDRRWSRKL